MKFKCEALPLKNELGGVRLLFSHNVEFPLPHVHENDPTSFDTLIRIFPVLAKLKKHKGEHDRPRRRDDRRGGPPGRRDHRLRRGD